MNITPHTPTDEQLAAYLSGTASEADVALVEAWLQEHPDHADDLLHISLAASLVRQEAAEKPSTAWYRRPAYWAAAAVVALMVVAGALWLQPAGVPQGPLVAQTDTPSPADLQSLPAEPATPTAPAAPSTQMADQAQPQVLRRDERSTASQAVADGCQPRLQVDFPRRQHEVVPAGQPLTFRWQSNARTLTLRIADDSGHTLLEQDLSAATQFTLPAAVVDGQTALRWTLQASFADGTTLGQEGTIIQQND